jgi:integrase/recombinase XerD
MRFDDAIDRYLDDMQIQGRLNSIESVRHYCATLEAHGEDVENRDPAGVVRADVLTTLRRWSGANTRSANRSMLISFYEWLMEEGFRTDNPARQTPRIRRRTPPRPRLTEAEAVRLLKAASDARERRAIFLGLCAGLRSAELRGVQGRHFAREDSVWVSADISKGQRERFIPATADLVPVIAEIRENVEHDEYVLRAQFIPGPPASRDPDECRWYPLSASALRALVIRVAQRARVDTHVSPHTLRHAFADHIVRGADVRVAQLVLGHAYLSTTVRYLRPPRYDDIAAAVEHLRYGA